MDDDSLTPGGHPPGEELTRPTRRESSHLFSPSGARPATEADARHINEEMEASMPDGYITDGSRWVFEKVIFNQYHLQRQHGGYLERILHLFALVDENGLVQQVGSSFLVWIV